MTLFGALTHGGQVEVAVRDTLQLWIGTYLREIERQHDREQLALPAPRSYQVVSESDDPARWPEDQLPAIVILSPGFAEEPRHGGDGSYDARYAVSVAAMVSANTQGATRQLARLYGIAIAAVLVQHSSLGSFATGVKWIDESYDDIPNDSSRSLTCVIEAFAVDVPAVLSSNAGPSAPYSSATETSPEWPEIESTTVGLTDLEPNA